MKGPWAALFWLTIVYLLMYKDAVLALFGLSIIDAILVIVLDVAGIQDVTPSVITVVNVAFMLVTYIYDNQCTLEVEHRPPKRKPEKKRLPVGSPPEEEPTHFIRAELLPIVKLPVVKPLPKAHKTPKLTRRTVPVSLYPGHWQLLFLSPKHITTLCFCDALEQPWVLCESILDETQFNYVSMIKGVSTRINLQPRDDTCGSITVMLDGLQEPLVFVFNTGYNAFDLDIDVWVRACVPRTRPGTYKEAPIPELVRTAVIPVAQVPNHKKITRGLSVQERDRIRAVRAATHSEVVSSPPFDPTSHPRDL